MNILTYFHSETVNATASPAPTMLVAYNNLKNAVYRGVFKVVIKTNNFTVSLWLTCVCLFDVIE